RRLDSTKTMADYLVGESSGVEHQNSQIWSAALREIFLALAAQHGLEEGKRIADTLVLESIFGLPPNPTFAANARRLLFVDSLLFGNQHAAAICSALSRRGIISDCNGAVPRGEWTLFGGRESGVRIPDTDPAGIISHVTITDPRAIESLRVRVDITHPSRGDLRVSLFAPDGSELVLQNVSTDRAADVHVTYGLDAVAVNDLSTLRGRSAAGVWQLRVSDLRARDLGTLDSWALLIQFAGDVRLDARPTNRVRYHFPAGHLIGAGGSTRWATDLRLFAGTTRTPVTLIFSSGNLDGRIAFAAANVVIEPGQVVILKDVVAALFGTSGFGLLEVASPSFIDATTRSYAIAAQRGTIGEIVRASGGATSGGFLSVLRVPVLRADSAFRSNLAIAEVQGGEAVVVVVLYDVVSGARLSMQSFTIQPHALVQLPVSGAALMRAEVYVATGEGAVRVFASVIDNVSNDPSIFSAPPRAGLAPAISARGATGMWRTDLWLSRFFEDGVVGPISFTDRSGTITRALPQADDERATFELRDVVATEFGSPGAFGFIDSGTHPFVARVYTDAPGGGTVGQTVVPSRSSYRDADLLFIDNDGT
ncbi:MAG TPA: proprotein convertase P-domain-containing protein, partial [Thermoanaerobaculia bacterium]|nr:proprotein convertase P-domain-containing protein [Thermoanaerobaculia bacterium]